jgi:hypothetical protein
VGQREWPSGEGEVGCKGVNKERGLAEGMAARRGGGGPRRSELDGRGARASAR